MINRKLKTLYTTLTSFTRQSLSILTFKEFDTRTSNGRSLERYRRVALTALSSGCAKAVSIITMVISVPLTLHYLGSERYGMWMTISSVVLMLSFTDLGIGNGLMNAISESHGKEDQEAAAQFISSGFFMLLAVGGLVLTVLALTYSFIPWPRVFNVKSGAAAVEAGPAMAVFVACFALNLPLGVVQRVQLGYQDGFVNNLWQSLGSVLALAGVLLVIYCQAGLSWLVLAVAGAPALSCMLNSVVLFGWRRPGLRPSWRKANVACARKILGIGIMFFVLQIAVVLAFTSDNIVAAQVLGPDAVTQYAVTSRIFNFGVLIVGMVLTPLWPAYGEAISRGDIPWVKKTLIRSLLMTVLVVGLPSLFLVLFGLKILHLWVGTAVTPSFSLLLGLGIWTIMSAGGNAVSMFLNGANILRFQIISALAVAVIALFGKIILTQRIGIPGVVWGNIVAYFFAAVIPVSIYLPKVLYKGATCRMK